MSTTPLNLVTDTVELPAPRIDPVLAPGAAPDAEALLRLVEVTLRELHPGAADLPPVTLASDGGTRPTKSWPQSWNRRGRADELVAALAVPCLAP